MSSNGSADHDSLNMIGEECLLAASNTKPIIHVWNMLRQSHKHRKIILSSRPTCISISPDHKLLAAGIEDKIHIWQLCTGNLLSVLSYGSVEVKCLRFSPCGHHLVSGYRDGTVCVWELQDHKHRKIILSSRPTCISISPDHKLLAAGIEDKIHIWQLCTGNLLSVLSYGSVEVKCLRFSPCGHHLVSGYRDGTVCVWELQDALCLDPRRMMDHIPVQTFRGHAGEIADIFINLSDNVVTCGSDYTARIWNLMSGQELKMFELGAPVYSMTMDHSELSLYAGDSLGNVYCIDLQAEMRSSEKTTHFDARETSEGFICHAIHKAAVRFLALTQNQSRLVSASDDCSVKIWSIMSSSSPLSIVLEDRVTNLMVGPIPQALVSPDAKPSVNIPNLKRHLHGTEKEDNADVVINIPSRIPMVKLYGARAIEEQDRKGEASSRKGNESLHNVSMEEVSSLREKASKLKKMNEEIYKYAVKAIVK